MLRNMTTIYINDNGRFLMLYRIGSKVIQPSWCGIGGHFEENEINNPKGCILRELHEEVGINENEIESLELKYITLRNKNAEIRQNYYFFSNLINNDIDISCCDEGKLEWIEINMLLNLEMPFTAKECLKHYLEVGMFSDKQYAGIATSKGIEFVELEEF